MKPLINDFFDRYAMLVNHAIRNDEADVDAAVKCFAGFIVESSPAGIAGRANDEAFRKQIPEGYRFYRQIGVDSMDILSKDITELDPIHAMARIHWQCAFTRKDSSKGKVAFDVIYLLQVQNNAPVIFAYITGDEQGVLKQEGLI